MKNIRVKLTFKKGRRKSKTPRISVKKLKKYQPHSQPISIRNSHILREKTPVVSSKNSQNSSELRLKMAD